MGTLSITREEAVVVVDGDGNVTITLKNVIDVVYL